jgi:hypothetical protein
MVMSGSQGNTKGNALADSILTLAIEYCIDTPIFILLSYHDNGQRLTDNLTGKKNLTKIKDDVKNLLSFLFQKCHIWL